MGMTPEQAFEEIANLLDTADISAEDAMKICSAICIGICIDSGKPKQIYIQYMSDAWNYFSNHRKEELTLCQ
jgi:hypothetical protein